MDDENTVQVVHTVYGDVCVRKARRKRQKLLAMELMYDYSEKTTLHGIPYMTKKGLTNTEKIFWLATVLISITWCSVLIYQLWVRWKTSPVIVTISEQVVPVSMVPFPAITICPQIKSKASVYNFTDIFFGTLTKIESIHEFRDVARVCNMKVYIPNFIRNITNSSLVERILMVSPDYDDVFLDCSWQGMDIACRDLFSIVLTNEGVCFTMNTLAYDEIFRIKKNESEIRPCLQDTYKYLNSTERTKGWALEDGYSTINDSYPKRGSEHGTEPDLRVTLKENSSEHDGFCNPTYSGFRVFMNHPSSLPQSSRYYYAVLNNQLSSVALSFRMLNTSETLKSYDSDVRQCYFPKDRYLKYFNNYTSENCWIECVSNFTFAKCGCVDFYMPHDNSEQLCAPEFHECVKDAQVELLEKERSSSAKTCNCLPACFTVSYDAEILKTEFNMLKAYSTFISHFNLSQNKSKYESINFSRIEVFFKQPRFLSMRRSELFGITEFLANCGGLLGLFMGFSFLSLVELFYFLTLRLWCTLKKDLEEEKAEEKIGKETQNLKF